MGKVTKKGMGLWVVVSGVSSVPWCRLNAGLPVCRQTLQAQRSSLEESTGAEGSLRHPEGLIRQISAFALIMHLRW